MGETTGRGRRQLRAPAVLGRATTAAVARVTSAAVARVTTPATRMLMASTVVATLAVAAMAAPVAIAASDPGAPVYGTSSASALKDRYLVVFERAAGSGDVRDGREEARQDGGRVHYEYGRVLKGFAATLPKKAVDRLRRHPRVAYLEADQTVRVVGTQGNPPWGLDRIDQRDLPLSRSYTYTPTGSGVRAYVIDTGIRATHTDFGGRAFSGYSAITDGNGTNDCNGHGTHVAGTIGGTTYGVAKGVSLYAVRVLDCNGSGSVSGVIAGVDWVTGNAVEPAVANMSLGGSASSALDTAVANSIARGVTYAIAAGNDNQDACTTSPARTAAAVTVGATTGSDARASFSNYGTCLDIFAPGYDITSAWHTGNSATATISGTSMAAPHVAGVAALYLQGNPTAAPQTVRDAIVNTATADHVTGAGSGSPNRLVFSPLGVGDLPPVTPCADFAERYSGSLTAGASVYRPSSSGYYTRNAGVHRGCLAGPSGANFDLYLYQRRNWTWVQVAAGTGPTSSELVSYNGPSGTYRWQVRAKTSSGAYTLGLQRP
jgi:subtilisin family serine protease